MFTSIQPYIIKSKQANLKENKMKKHSLIITPPLLLLLLLLLSNSSDGNTTIPPLQKQVFLLAGQSNMVGRGGVAPGQPWDAIVPLDDSPDPRILRLAANLAWKEAHDPLHFDIDTKETTGVGPGMSFANSIKGYMHGPIGLVPCAIGGTRIVAWARGTIYYNRLINRAKVAGNGGEIKALLWYQGESNVRGSDQDIAEFKNETVQFFRNVRHDLNIPDLPIIQVVIGNVDNGKNATVAELLKKVRQAQLTIRLSNLVTVSAVGLPVNPADFIHLTTDSQVQLGRVLARAYLQNYVILD